VKSFILTLLISISFSNVFAQKEIFKQVNEVKNKTNAVDFSPFDIISSSNVVRSSFITNSTALQLNANKTMLLEIETKQPSFLSLSIPFSASSSFDLELIPNDIFGSTYKVLNAQNQEVKVSKGVYYKGIIKGDAQSLVSISIVDGEVSGIISNNKGNFVLGKIVKSDNYIFYNDRELIEKSKFECDVKDDNLKKIIDSEIKSSLVTNVACRAVQIYFEADYAIYTAQGSNMTTATNFVNALFGQVAVLYDNEGIDVQISQLKIWNTADPYISTTSTLLMLRAFSSQVGTAFVGDLAHLISGRPLGGGVAYLDVLCNKGTGISANIRNTVVNVPTYSWNVEVVTHELGHNFGSRHTQSCSWPGGPIDNCYAVEDGPCSPGPTPTNGGTIMSYCHLTGVGINFNNGFGTLPGNLIRSRTQNCMGNAVTPSNLVVLDTYNTSVTLVWESAGGPYTVEYKPSSSSSWLSTTTSTKVVQLTSLTPSTAYDWRVNANCSAYATGSFTTNTTPAIVYCAINHTTGCNTYAMGLADVIIGGINYNPSSGCTSSGGYSFIYTPVRTLQIGQTYSITLNPLWIDGNAIQAAIWIDYNKNGTFETSEKVFTTTTSTSSPITGTFTVPVVSSSQTKTRMRVITNFSAAPTNPCGEYTYGESEEFLVDIVCLSLPSAPTTTGGSRCGTGTVSLSATSCPGTLNWYDVSAGGTSLGTTSPFITPSISATTTYYVDCTVNACTSASRSSAIATLTSLPSAPTTTGGSRCGTGTVSLSATSCAGTLNWYDASTGGTSLGTTSPFITPSISATTTYYVDCTVNACSSASRSSAIATLTSPSAPTVSGGECVSAETTLTASGCAGTYHWYLNDISGSDLGTGISLFGVTPGTYYVNCTVNTCISEGTTTIVKLIPSPPTVAGETITSGQTATLTATGCAGTVNWYASSTGTAILYTGINYTTPTLAVNTTYYANCVVNVCTSASRTAALVTISTCPSVLTLVSTTDDVATGNITKEASATASNPSTNANIMASNKITGAGTKVTYQAKSVLLKPGFKADTGTIFKAEIGGCN